MVDAEALERLSWRNWTSVVGVILLNSMGLALGAFPQIRERVGDFWPWAGTDEALIGGLVVVLLLFTIHLTRQQRQLVKLRARLKRSMQETHRDMQDHCDRLFALLNVTRTLATETDPEVIFEVITTACKETFACEQVSLMLLDRKAEELVVRAANGHANEDEVRSHRVRVGQGIAGWVAEHRQPLILGKSVDPDRYPGFTPRNQNLSAAMVVPITVRDELVGVLNVGSRADSREYKEDDLRALLVFAENAGITCRHAEQTNWMRETIQRLDRELQSRDQRLRPAA
jgi:transcriptional regulator with GAF, ATPase, and Fis domain